MRQRKMCKAANESDLLVVVVQHKLVEHGEGPLFLASVLCSFSFEGGIFLGHWPSVGRLVMMLHTYTPIIAEKGDKTSRRRPLCGRRPQACNSPSIMIREDEGGYVLHQHHQQVKAGTLELLRRLESTVNRLSRRQFPYLSITGGGVALLSILVKVGLLGK